MKKDIHPKYNHKIKVTCTGCGNTFYTGSVLDSITVEICSKCHPFYTGVAKVIDTENLIKKFNNRQAVASKKKASFSAKKRKAKAKAMSKKNTSSKPTKELTLKDMLAGLAQ
jgi:large subunit ribosomal protein L31